MTTKERYAGVIKWFQENKPIAETELQYHDPFQLLIAVILSAQCTDKRVNMITPALFEAFPTPQDLAAATPEEVYTYIKSVSYPNNKSKHLVGNGSYTHRTVQRCRTFRNRRFAKITGSGPKNSQRHSIGRI